MTSMRAYPSNIRPVFEWLVAYARWMGLDPRVTSTVRTRAEQEALYAKALRGENPYPVARPGTSRHERGLAIDLVSRDNAALGKVWNAVGGRWSPQDAVHFEIPG